MAKQNSDKLVDKNRVSYDLSVIPVLYFFESAMSAEIFLQRLRFVS